VIVENMTKNPSVSTPTNIHYFIGVVWFFYSHFLDRAIAAKAAGFDVVVVTGLTRSDDPLAQYGIKLIGIPFERRSLNPIGLIRNLLDIIQVLKQEKPDIIHQIALKPILIGSIACRALGVKRVISAVVGLGFAFSSDKATARIIRRVLSVMFRVVLDKQHAKTVFENTDDRDYFVAQGWVREESAVLIRGAGVDVERFKPPRVDKAAACIKRDSPPIVMLLSRMLWDKGIGEFVEAARLLRQQHGDGYAQFVLVGDPDDDNRGAISREQLLRWQDEGVVQWWGFKPDVENVLSQATLSCLPSYREGLPKSLLESLAMGLPCIATDVPGCREAVIDGVNGLLVPVRDAAPLAQAIERLLSDPDLCLQFGQASRQMALSEFSSDLVNQQTLALYAQVSLGPEPMRR
jgi:glycosyltransferase involved in cell wall biosynthesis